MSVVIDAVNSFFGHERQYHHDNAPPPWQVHMSHTARRASGSSSSTSTTQQQQIPRPQNASRSTSHSSAYNDARPSSPPLAPRDAPPSSETPQPATQATSASMASATESRQSRPQKIKVRDLEHIQSFAREDMGAFSEIKSGGARSRSAGTESPQYEISEMKVEHIIEMVAGLLTKITTTNDQQHEHLHRQPPHLESTSHLNPQTNSVLAFHGKNVPSITILSYLTRINKYCPTSYEVFLSLLVYFDRMTEKVNAGPMQSLRQANRAAMEHNRVQSSRRSSSESSADSDEMEGIETSTPQESQLATPPASGSLEKAIQEGRPGTPHSRSVETESPQAEAAPDSTRMMDPYNLSHFFVVDSFNIHRLVIAGVTCASKFFSDIFYTNSRYAKVGGLPLPELNHLELQFLLLNDFRLSVPVEEIEAYGTMLVEFYAREIVAQQKAAQQAEAQAMLARSLSESSEDSTVTVRAAH